MSDRAPSADVATLLEEASRTMKGDLAGTLAKLEQGYHACLKEKNQLGAGEIACALSRGWARRKSAAQSVHYARKATLLAPGDKASWTTLAKTCELVALRCSPSESWRAKILFAGAARSFKKAASMATDPEDKRWLLELASDAAKQAR